MTQPPDQRTEPDRPEKQLTQRPPVENPKPVDWVDYLDRPEYTLMTPPEARLKRPMLYDKTGKYVGDAPAPPPTATEEPPK